MAARRRASEEAHLAWQGMAGSPFVRQDPVGFPRFDRVPSFLLGFGVHLPRSGGFPSTMTGSNKIIPGATGSGASCLGSAGSHLPNRDPASTRYHPVRRDSTPTQRDHAGFHSAERDPAFFRFLLA